MSNLEHPRIVIRVSITMNLLNLSRSVIFSEVRTCPAGPFLFCVFRSLQTSVSELLLKLIFTQGTKQDEYIATGRGLCAVPFMALHASFRYICASRIPNHLILSHLSLPLISVKNRMKFTKSGL